MAIMIIKSDNEKLSYALQKNPATGLLMKKHKQGCLFAYFPIVEGKTDEQTYVVYFKDSSEEISYKEHVDMSFEYLNNSKYNNARFVNDAIQELFYFTRENDLAEDVPAKCSIEINLLETHFKTIDIFQRYFPAVSITHKQVSDNNYNIKFTSVGEMTMKDMFLTVNLFGIFASLNSSDYIYITQDLVRKYIRIANDINAPYFIKYLIKIRMCRSEKNFFEFKEELEKSATEEIKMLFGDTHQMRISWIKEMLDSPANSIVDIGTGIDFRYLKIFAPILKTLDKKYYAIERDEDAIARIKAGIKNRALEDVVMVFESLDEFISYNQTYLNGEKFDVICTEVLEHNEKEQAKKIVNKVIKNIDFDKFIVTVPNEDFNKYYGLVGFRHDDHKWEAKEADLHAIMPKAKSQIYAVGDMVDGVPVSFGVVVKNDL